MKLISAPIITLLAATTLPAEPPVVADPRLKLELVAAAPDIVTPTGIAVDSRDRVWCFENHTHQRTPDYKGPPTDRVRVFEDFDAAGKARKVWTFAEGFKDSMGLTFGRDGAIYLATRAKIFRLREKDGKETERTVIARLETKGDYPHNGLCGFAWDGNGDLIFGLGENLGEPYKLVGSDGTTLAGGGEGGSMYRCRPDGSKLSRIATGFWNPFAHCVDARGNLFMVDNDPDARGPCRLVHVVQGGDYGYRFRYGRKGLHPFTAWNGELPGTLPMVAGTSEAPSGIIACDFAALPEGYAGKLLVTSWGDHTIEAFELKERGASFSAKSKVVVRGGEDFRPVGLAVAPDGSILVSDWVDKSYPVHGKGRIWRLSAPKFSGKPKTTVPLPTYGKDESQWHHAARAARTASARAEGLRHLHSPDLTREFIPALADPDPYVASAALTALGRPGNSGMLREALAAKPQAALRLGLLLALRRTGDAEARKALPEFLADADPQVRRTAIQWVAEEGLKEHAGKLREAALQPLVTRELLEAWVKADEMLAGAKGQEEGDHGVITQVLLNESLPPVVRALALRMLRPDHPLLSAKLLAGLFEKNDPELRGAVVRTAMLRPDAGSQRLLHRIALDLSQALEYRALAVTGLAQSAGAKETLAALERVSAEPALRSEAERSLGRRKPEPKRSVAEWRKLLAADTGDARAGERVFFSANGAGCFKCHRVEARGASTGPDLTFVGKALTRDRLIESILEPGKEVAPMFTAWRILTRDGKERIAMIAGETHDSLVTLVDAQGQVEKVRRTDIEERSAVRQSIMPDDLPNLMTRQEFLDLLAYLIERR